jgi:hypothetical protein
MNNVAVLIASPTTSISNYGRVMSRIAYAGVLSEGVEIGIKIDRSLTRFYPARSTPPWRS